MIIEKTVKTQKAGRPKVSLNRKKKACNILLTPDEIKVLETTAYYYGLNKSAFIALLIQKIFPHIKDYVQSTEGMRKQDLSTIKTINKWLESTPSKENLHKTICNRYERSTSEATYSNKDVRKEYNSILKDNQELASEVERLRESVKLRDELYDVLSKKSLETINSFDKSLAEERKKNALLEKKLGSLKK